MVSLLLRALHAPSFYDVVQRVAGDATVQRALGEALAGSAPGFLVDIGGGTGLGAALPAGTRYVCLDIDQDKLTRFRSKSSEGRAVLGNATALPLRNGSANTVVCAKVSHHLTDQEFEAALREVARVLAPGGRLILLDALASPRRTARLLWRLDRGSHPRTFAGIHHRLPAALEDVGLRTFRASVFHDFALWVRRKVPSDVGPPER